MLILINEIIMNLVRAAIFILIAIAGIKTVESLVSVIDWGESAREFRYATDESSKGMFRGHYLDDDLSDPSEEAYYRDGSFSHSNVERYWIRGKADQNFGDWITRLDIDVVSDKDYLREFNSGSTAFNANNRLYYNAFGRSSRPAPPGSCA